MDFALSQDQLLLQRTAADLADRLFSGTLQAASRDPASLRARAWRHMVELDLVGLMVPEDDGGAGGTATDACIVAEVLGRYIAPVPYVGTAIGAAAFLRFAAGPRDALARLCRGESFSLLLDARLQEPSTEAGIAFDWSEGASGIALSGDGVATVRDLVDAVPITDIDPLHPLCHVRPVPARAAVTDGGRRARAVAWTGAAAFLTGLADGALQQAVTYARQREQYGRPIGSFQAVQHLCADMLFDVETSRSITYGASWAVEHAPIDEAERLAAAAKAYAGTAAIKTCETNIQVLGGIGVTREHDAHLRLRSAHLHNTVLGGTDAPLLLLAARTLAMA